MAWWQIYQVCWRMLWKHYIRQSPYCWLLSGCVWVEVDARTCWCKTLPRCQRSLFAGSSAVWSTQNVALSLTGTTTGTRCWPRLLPVIKRASLQTRCCFCPSSITGLKAFLVLGRMPVSALQKLWKRILKKDGASSNLFFKLLIASVIDANTFSEQ